MSSLQPDLVYKHTITFTAELAGLPWVQLEKPEGSQLPLLHGTSPTFRALLLQTHLPALCLYLFVLGRHQPVRSLGDALLEMLRQHLSHPIPVDPWSYPFALLGSEQQQIPEPLLVLYNSMSTYRDQQAHIPVSQPTTMAVRMRI